MKKLMMILIGLFGGIIILGALEGGGARSSIGKVGSDTAMGCLANLFNDDLYEQKIGSAYKSYDEGGMTKENLVGFYATAVMTTNRNAEFMVCLNKLTLKGNKWIQKNAIVSATKIMYKNHKEVIDSARIKSEVD